MTVPRSQVIHGDCLQVLATLADASIDLVYLDPPFFTNRHHSAVSRDRNNRFSFADVWYGLAEYGEFMQARMQQIHRVLKDSGSVFVHCDTSANFILRALLNGIFSEDQFRSEIIWSYRRWSNAAKGLLPAHQTIFFYSKTDGYKFNRSYGAYSETTNLDQILQLRTKDGDGVSVYATDQAGDVIYGNEKKGVPLSDVWEIPFLNPKAKERTGYPTQKPILLLERIIELASDAGDLVLDPFCGSGTTLVAAQLLQRRSIGIDSSSEAVALSLSRLDSPIKTESALLKKGREAYVNVDQDALALLSGLDILPVQRNAGIDAFLKTPVDGVLVPIRVQRKHEALAEAANKLARAASSKKAKVAILVRTQQEDGAFFDAVLPKMVEVVDSTALLIKARLAEICAVKMTILQEKIETGKMEGLFESVL
jgi:site-specific DNA-methyltransferase (adenine-specific)